MPIHSSVRTFRILVAAMATAASLASGCSSASPVEDIDTAGETEGALTSDSLDGTRFAAPFVTPDQLWQRVEEMVAFGPRHTASPAHEAFLGYLEAWMRRIGLTNIGRDEVTLSGPNLFTTPGAPTSGISHHLYGFLPGATSEVVVLGMHSDGQNSVEENGTVVALSIVEHLAKLPIAMRRRGVLVVFPTSHMAKSDSEEADGWVANHPELVSKVVAIVSPEHMGTLNLLTRGPENYRIWATSPALRWAALDATRGLPMPNTTISSFGIGSAIIWKNATALPTIGGMSIPSYLFDPSKKMEVLDKGRLFAQAETFRRIMRSVDGMSRDDLGL